MGSGVAGRRLLQWLRCGVRVPCTRVMTQEAGSEGKLEEYLGDKISRTW